MTPIYLILGVLLMAAIGHFGRRAFQKLKIKYIEPTVTEPVAAEPDEPAPTGLTGQPMGLLLLLTYAS